LRLPINPKESRPEPEGGGGGCRGIVGNRGPSCSQSTSGPSGLRRVARRTPRKVAGAGHAASRGSGSPRTWGDSGGLCGAPSMRLRCDFKVALLVALAQAVRGET